MSPCPTLPFEIAAEIIDYHKDDIHVLIDCSLVCQDFLYASRRHLFRELNLHPQTTRLDTFIALLAPLDNRILPFIRQVNLNMLGQKHPSDEFIKSVNSLISLWPWPPSTHTLHMKNAVFDVFPKELTYCLLRQVSKFPNVKLSDVRFSSFSDFVQFSQDFRDSQSLTLNRISWASDEEKIISHKISCTLKSLEILGHVRSRLVEWILSYVKPPPITGLVYHVRSRDTFAMMIPLFNIAAPTLQYLRIRFPIYSNEFANLLQNYIDITQCTNLRSLEFHDILLSPSESQTSSIINSISQVLSQVSPHSIQRLSFHFLIPRTYRIQADTMLSNFCWDALQNMLNSPFQSMEYLLFSIPPLTLDQNKAVEYIANKLDKYQHLMLLE